MRIRDLHNVLTPFCFVVIGDRKGPILREAFYNIDNKNEYGDCDISELIPKVSETGIPYLVIIIKE